MASVKEEGKVWVPRWSPKENKWIPFVSIPPKNESWYDNKWIDYRNVFHSIEECAEFCKTKPEVNGNEN